MLSEIEGPDAVGATASAREVSMSASGCAAVAGELIAAADAEAAAAADRLHDGAVQALLVARYAADAAERGGDLAEVRPAVQTALVELRRAVWHLRPRGAADGLGPALRQLAERLQEAGRPALTYDVADEPADRAPAFASTAYRLTQAVALAPDALAIDVRVRRQDSVDVLEVTGGAPLPDPARWAARARALGGTVTCSAGPPPSLRLAVPDPQSAGAPA